MEITIDTSALIAVIGNESSKQRIIKLTEGSSLIAPTSVHWEIGNAFSAMFKRQAISIEAAQEALAVYHSIPIKFIDVPLSRTVHIAKEFNLYAYDAYLIQCAEQTTTHLLTLDRGLASIAKQMGIALLLETKEF